MSEAARRRMTLDEFDDWQALQEVRCEFVDGYPVVMPDATFARGIVVSNVIQALGNGLNAAGNPCRAFTANIGLVTGPSTLRRPAVTVYCPPFDSHATRSEKARLVVEVGLPFSRKAENILKLREYSRLSALWGVLLIEPERVEVGLWRLQPGSRWKCSEVRDDITATLELPCFGINLAVADLYSGVNFC